MHTTSLSAWAGIAVLALSPLARATAAVAPPHAAVAAEAAASAPAKPSFGKTHVSAATARVARWAVGTHDNLGQPFAIIDKPNARLYVFDAQGRLRGNAPVLLGKARGDDSAPGIGDKKLSDVTEDEKTTPAGRFVAEQGTNLRNEHVIWIDYNAAVSMHPVLTTNPSEHRLERLATPSIADNRISFGCVNVPKAFFQSKVLATLDTPHPIVYVLPDVKPLDKVFAGIDAPLDAGHPTAVAAATAPRHP